MRRLEKLGMTLTEKIYKLELECFTEPWSQKSIETLAQSENFIISTEFDNDGNLIAYAFGECIKSINQAEIYRIAVLPQMRNQGLGQEVLKNFINLCENNQCEIIILEVRENNKSAISLYEKLHFNIVGVRKKYYQNPDESAVLMEYIFSL